MNKFARLAKRIESFRDEMVNLQIKLCAVPAIAPSNGGEGEVEKARLLADFLKQIPVDDTEFVNAPDMEAPAGYRPNILAVVKGQKSSRTAWIMTHMDIVPPGELAQWEGDPFKAWVRGGKVFGRGVEDNQQDQVASLFAVKALRAEKILARARTHGEGHYIDREELKRMLPEERELFEAVVMAIGQSRCRLIPAPSAGAGVSRVEAAEEAGRCSEVLGAQPITQDYVLSRVLSDMDPFMGVDGRIYQLSHEDIVMLPLRNAEVLCERNIVLNINPGK